AAQGVVNPALSPDGQSVVFWSGTDQTLKRVAVRGGSVATTVCAAARPYGVAWTPNGIFFGDASKGILRVSPNGGQPDLVIGLGAGEVGYGPQVLPGGEWVLFTLAPTGGVDRWNRAKLVVQSLRTGERRVVLEGGTEGRYVPTGHLVYAAGGLLLARGFDLRRLEARGGAVTVVEGVRRSDGGQTGAAHFAVSETGALVYIPGPVFSL